MSKPVVFNYDDYVKAQERIQAQAKEIIRLKEENTNLQIHVRILEEERSHAKDDNGKD